MIKGRPLHAPQRRNAEAQGDP
jgi:hypothetical protein